MFLIEYKNHAKLSVKADETTIRQIYKINISTPIFLQIFNNDFNCYVDISWEDVSDVPKGKFKVCLELEESIQNNNSNSEPSHGTLQCMNHIAKTVDSFFFEKDNNVMELKNYHDNVSVELNKNLHHDPPWELFKKIECSDTFYSQVIDSEQNNGCSSSGCGSGSKILIQNLNITNTDTCTSSSKPIFLQYNNLQTDYHLPTIDCNSSLGKALSDKRKLRKSEYSRFLTLIYESYSSKNQYYVGYRYTDIVNAILIRYPHLGMGLPYESAKKLLKKSLYAKFNNEHRRNDNQEDVIIERKKTRMELKPSQKSNDVLDLDLQTTKALSAKNSYSEDISMENDDVTQLIKPLEPPFDLPAHPLLQQHLELSLQSPTNQQQSAQHQKSLQQQEPCKSRKERKAARKRLKRLEKKLQLPVEKPVHSPLQKPVDTPIEFRSHPPLQHLNELSVYPSLRQHCKLSLNQPIVPVKVPLLKLPLQRPLQQPNERHMRPPLMQLRERSLQHKIAIPVRPPFQRFPKRSFQRHIKPPAKVPLLKVPLQQPFEPSMQPPFTQPNQLPVHILLQGKSIEQPMHPSFQQPSKLSMYPPQLQHHKHLLQKVSQPVQPSFQQCQKFPLQQPIKLPVKVSLLKPPPQQPNAPVRHPLKQQLKLSLQSPLYQQQSVQQQESLPQQEPCKSRKEKKKEKKKVRTASRRRLKRLEKVGINIGTLDNLDDNNIGKIFNFDTSVEVKTKIKDEVTIKSEILENSEEYNMDILEISDYVVSVKQEYCNLVAPANVKVEKPTTDENIQTDNINESSLPFIKVDISQDAEDMQMEYFIKTEHENKTNNVKDDICSFDIKPVGIIPDGPNLQLQNSTEVVVSCMFCKRVMCKKYSLTHLLKIHNFSLDVADSLLSTSFHAATDKIKIEDIEDSCSH